MASLKCPHCHNKIEISIAPGVAARPGAKVFESTARRVPFKSAAAAAPLPPSYEAYTETTSFLPTTESHVKVPFLQAIIAGGFVGLIVGVVVTSACVYGKIRFGTSLMYGSTWALFTFMGISCIYWFARTSDYNGLLRRVETVTGLDINQDGDIGEPEPAIVRVEVKEGKTWKFANLPGDNAALQSFARDVVNGIRTFSEAGANDNGYGISNFKKLRDLFIDRGWAVWNHPTNKQQGGGR